MKKIIYKIINALFLPLYGKKQTQSLFWAIYNIGIQGLNLRNCESKKNGELFFIQEIYRFYKDNNQSPIIFDVGANIGNYAELVTNTFTDVDYTLYCFEPLPKAFEVLETKFNNHHTIFTKNYAISNSSEKKKLFFSSDCAETASMYRKSSPFYKQEYGYSIDMESHTLKEIFETEHISNINFLKIDVEGSEFDIIAGNFNEIKHCDFIQFEFGQGNIYSKTFFNDFFTVLQEHFILYRLLRNGLEKMNNYLEDYEIFIVGNYIAIHKEIQKNVKIKGTHL